MQPATGMGGGLLCPFLKIEIMCPDFRRGKMHWLCSSMSSISHLKCCFESILEKKLWNFFLRGLSFMCCKWNVYRSALIQRNLTCPEKFLFGPLRVHFEISVCLSPLQVRALFHHFNLHLGIYTGNL